MISSLLHELFSTTRGAEPRVMHSASAVLEEIGRVGYAVFPLLHKHEYEQFYQDSLVFMRENGLQQGLDGFFSIGRAEQGSVRTASKEIVRKYLETPLSGFFSKSEFDHIFGTHLLKPPGKSGILNPHQDGAHVDELRYTSYHVWIPVSAPDQKAGMLQVVPCSHRLQIPYRSLNIPWPLLPFEKKLWKYMVGINLQPGQAVAFQSNLLHASGENRSDAIRIAANALIKPVGCDFIHCYSDEATGCKQIELYKIDPDFYYRENILERPKHYPLLATVPNLNKSYTLPELHELFKNH